MEELPEEVVKFMTDDCWFIVPPRYVWQKFCEEMDFEGKY